MGLKNSSAAFQRLLDFVTRGLRGCHVFIDDILICSDDHEQHLQDLEGVLQRMCRYGLKAKISKVQLGTGTISYLGHEISRDHGVRAGKAKTDAIRRWPEPTSLRALRGFLGLGSFFRRSIRSFALIASPLTRLTRKDSGWTGGPMPRDAVLAFHALKDALCSRPCLAPVDWDRQFIVTVDTASERGIGAILSQIGADGVERPCAYASRALTPKERGGSAFSSELGGLVWAARYYRPYITGTPWLARTDHKSLLALNNARSPVLTRLQAEMESFLPYTLQYLRGADMPSDGLSRMMQDGNATDRDTDGRQTSGPTLDGRPQVCTQTSNGRQTSGPTSDRRPQVHTQTSNGRQTSGPTSDGRPQVCTQTSNGPQTSRPTATSRPTVDRGPRSVQVDAVTINQEQIYHLQKQDAECKALAVFLKFRQLPMHPPLRRLVHKLKDYVCIQNGVICLRNGPVRGADKLQVYAPVALRHTLLLTGHDSPQGGHFSGPKTFAKLAEGWFWPGYRQDIVNYCRQCVKCNEVNRPAHRRPVPMGRKAIASHFNASVSIDLMGPLPVSPAGNRSSSQWSTPIRDTPNWPRLPNKTTASVASALLDTWVTAHGCPRRIFVGSGWEFDFP